MNKLTLVLTYYDCPEMLHQQMIYWQSYLKGSVKIILIDDCSMKYPAEREVSRGCFNVPIEIYRITKNIPQNIWGARNLAFRIALLEKIDWVLCLDIDHTLPLGSVQDFLNNRATLNPLCYYVPSREEVSAYGLVSMGCHSDSFLIDPKLFWKTGGYDEDLTGYYFQGAAFHFRRNLNAISRRVSLNSLSTHFYSSAIISDASPLQDAPKTIAPPQPKNKKQTTLNFNWERTL